MAFREAIGWGEVLRLFSDFFGTWMGAGKVFLDKVAEAVLLEVHTLRIGLGEVRQVSSAKGKLDLCPVSAETSLRNA